MHAAPSRTHARARARESGFTLIELLIALVIIAVLIIVAMRSFGGATSATRSNEARATGGAYLQAVAQFQADNANRNPPMTGGNTAANQAGPRNLLNRPYLATIPEAVTGGRVGVSYAAMGGAGCTNAKNTPAGAGAHTGWVSVCLGPAPQYGVRVLTRTKPNSPWNDPKASICWHGAAPAGSKRC